MFTPIGLPGVEYPGPPNRESSADFRTRLGNQRGAQNEDELADFSTNRRGLLLSALALAIGMISSLVAYALIWLIAAITNLAFDHRLSVASAMPQGHPLGLWVVLVPVVGALVIGLMARFGSEKIRGHGIPAALEAILLGRSRMDLKVAIKQPNHAFMIKIILLKFLIAALSGWVILNLL